MNCRKEMVEILKCYLIPKKGMTLYPRVQFFLANPVYGAFKMMITTLFYHDLSGTNF